MASIRTTSKSVGTTPIHSAKTDSSHPDQPIPNSRSGPHEAFGNEKLPKKDMEDPEKPDGGETGSQPQHEIFRYCNDIGITADTVWVLIDAFTVAFSLGCFLGTLGTFMAMMSATRGTMAGLIAGSALFGLASYLGGVFVVDLCRIRVPGGENGFEQESLEVKSWAAVCACTMAIGFFVGGLVPVLPYFLWPM